MKLSFLIIVFSLLVASPALPSSFEDCSGSNSELSIKSCSAIIKAGDLGEKELAAIHAYRGRAYANTGAHYLAITDYDMAISLNRFDGSVYYYRGKSYEIKGEFKKALNDFRYALAVIPSSNKLNDETRSLIAEMEKTVNSSEIPKEFPGGTSRNPRVPLPRPKPIEILMMAGANMTIEPAVESSPKQKSKQIYDRIIGDKEVLAGQYGVANENSTVDRESKRSPLPQALSPPNAQPDTTSEPTQVSVQTKAGNRVALVVGNGAYQHVAGLPNPTRDSTDIAAALGSIGFAVKELENVSKRELEDALSDFSDAASGADFALVYFAGHGMELDGQNYLIPVDAKLATDRRLQFEAVTLEYVLSALDAVSGVRMVLLDACRNNTFAPTMKLTGASRSVSRGLAPVEAKNGTVISFAAKAGTTAADGEGRNSPFTAALLESVTKPGLEVQFLLREVRDRVLALTDGAQEPFTAISLSSQAVYLVPPVDISNSTNVTGVSLAPVIDKVAIDFELTKEVGTSEAWSAFLNSHGNLKDNFHVNLARAAQKKLLATLPPPEEQAPTIEHVTPEKSDVVADEGLKLCNNTTSRIGFAIGYKDSSGWVSEGWWTLEAGRCVNAHPKKLKGRYYYAYAVDFDKGGSWGGKAMFCIQDKMFTIRGVEDCVGRGYQSTGFFEVDTGSEESWTISLSGEKMGTSSQPQITPESFVPLPVPPAPAVAKASGYSITLASFRSELEARTEYNNLRVKHATILDGLSPLFKPATVGGTTRYRLELGSLPSRERAVNLCNALVAAGEKDCLVRRQ